MRQILANLGAANATVHRPHLPEHFGVHHSKVGPMRCRQFLRLARSRPSDLWPPILLEQAFVLEYEHGLRVIVHTANKIHCDCNSKSQVQSEASRLCDGMRKQLLHGNPCQHEPAWHAGLVGARLPPQGTDCLPAPLQVSILVTVPVVRAFFVMTALVLRLKAQHTACRAQVRQRPRASRRTCWTICWHCRRVLTAARLWGRSSNRW
jgi:hypothetical protein